MRLHDRDHASGGAFAGCSENRADLVRMVSVIVDDDCAIGSPTLGEAALDALELFRSPP